jgi:hypothetical protein
MYHRARQLAPLSVLLGLLLTLPVQAAEVAVTTAAARVGTYGLEVTYDDTSQAYLVDNSPNDETRYIARFWININDLSMLPCNDMQIFRGRQQQPAPFNVFTLHIYRTCSDQGDFSYVLIPLVLQDNGQYKLGSAEFTIPFRNHVITVDWKASSGPGANDGFFRLYKGPNLRVNMTGLDNDTFGIDQVHMGGVVSIDEGTTGSIYLDEFESSRVPLF